MSWQQLKIQTTKQYAEQINSFFNLFGAVSVSLQDAADEPLLEPGVGETPLWLHTWVIGLFALEIDCEKIIGFIQAELGSTAIVNYSLEKLADQNWERAWLKDFQPMRFGKNLWICPSVFEPPDQNAINIILDPGLAFGTGTHPTTALCLEWLDANPPRDEIVIDYGCGSGILAIAALKLGAKEAWAVDHDEQALEATRDNGNRNQIDSEKLRTCFPEQLPALQADVLLANILANPLITLATRFGALLKPHGKLVLAGILQTQTQSIMDAYSHFFSLPKISSKEEWVLLSSTKKNRKS